MSEEPVIPLVTLIGILAVIPIMTGRGLPALRREHPEAVAVAVYLLAEDVDDCREISGVRLSDRRGHLLDVTLEPTLVRFWKGRRPRLVGTIDRGKVDYSVGNLTSLAGKQIPVLKVTVSSVTGTQHLRLCVQAEGAIIFQRGMKREGLEAIVNRLQAQGATL